MGVPQAITQGAMVNQISTAPGAAQNAAAETQGLNIPAGGGANEATHLQQMGSPQSSIAPDAIETSVPNPYYDFGTTSGYPQSGIVQSSPQAGSTVTNPAPVSTPFQGSDSLIATSAQGLSTDPNSGRSQLLGA